MIYAMWNSVVPKRKNDEIYPKTEVEEYRRNDGDTSSKQTIGGGIPYARLGWGAESAGAG